ncbi:MAG: hypothetical protein AAF512_01370 [Pseudomonadota bacterium]
MANEAFELPPLPDGWREDIEPELEAGWKIEAPDIEDAKTDLEIAEGFECPNEHEEKGVYLPLTRKSQVFSFEQGENGLPKLVEQEPVIEYRAWACCPICGHSEEF